MTQKITHHINLTIRQEGGEAVIGVSFLSANMGAPLPSDEELAKITTVNAPLGSQAGFGGQMLQLLGSSVGPALRYCEGDDLPNGEYTVLSWSHASKTSKKEPSGRYYRGPGGSATGDLIRASSALDLDGDQQRLVWKMLNGG